MRDSRVRHSNFLVSSGKYNEVILGDAWAIRTEKRERLALTLALIWTILFSTYIYIGVN